MTAPAPTLDLTGGHLNVRVNQGDGEGFIVPLPSDLTAWSWSATGGLTLTVQPTQLIVRIPATVTAALAAGRAVAYAITCRQGTGDPTTVLSGSLTL